MYLKRKYLSPKCRQYAFIQVGKFFIWLFNPFMVQYIYNVLFNPVLHLI